jgi:hypothetical protein
MAALSRAAGLEFEASMAQAEHPAPSVDAQKAMSYLPSFVRRVSAHQFQLADLPPDLRDALADYDVDGDGACLLAAAVPGPHATPAQERACRCFALSAVTARRHGDCERDRGGRSPPAPAEEKGTCRRNQLLLPAAQSLSADEASNPFLAPPLAPAQNALMFKVVVGLFTLLVLQLGAITGLVSAELCLLAPAVSQSWI